MPSSHGADPRGSKKTGKIVEYQEVEVDAGESDKRLLVVEPEFARALKAASRRESTLSPVLREAWDSGSLSTLTKSRTRQRGARFCRRAHHQGRVETRAECVRLRERLRQPIPVVLRPQSQGAAIRHRPVGDAAATTKGRIQSAVMWARARGDDFVVSMDSSARQRWKADYSRLSADQPGWLAAS